MNASRLLEIVTLLLEKEEEQETQSRLGNVNTALSQLVASPAEPTYQQAFASALDEFRNSLHSLGGEFQPAQIKLLEEIGSGDFFVKDIASDISEWISSSPATPAVAQEKLSKFVKKRASFLTELEQLRDSLIAVGIKTNGLIPGQAEIGFQLPRELFDNQLDKLIGELRFIRRAIRAFSEAATGSAQPIEVRQISTSDPLFFFGIDTITIGLLGAAVTWALNTWKQVEEIRKIRAETSKIDAFKDDPINEMFEATIQRTISSAVDAKVEQIVGAIEGSEARKNEQRSDLKWALESILGRVERGMTVEIRMLPPPSTPDEPANEAVRTQFEDLKQIAEQLSFPRMVGDPVLHLPPIEPENAKKK